MDGATYKIHSNQEAEIALLGCILNNNKLIIKCIDEGIKASDFTGINFDFMYNTMLELHKNKKPIELVSISDEFKKAGGYIEATVLTKMATAAIEININYYISQVKDMAYKRKVKLELENVINDLADMDSTLIKSSIEDVAKGLEYSNSIENMLVNLSEIKREDLHSGLKTGFRSLDNLTNGLVFGSLCILTGEPSTGKSTILNQILAENISAGHKALIYSGELTGFNLFQWFMRTTANPCDLKEFKSKNGIYYDVTSYGEHMIRQWTNERLLLFNDDISASIENLVNAIDFSVREKDVELVIIDNLMTVENGNTDEYDKQKILAKKLKAMARKHKICIILVAHPKKKQDKNKYHMHDVSGASEVVNLADYELLLTRDIKDDAKGRTDITNIAIMKNRITGRQGIKMRLHFDEIRKRFYTNADELNRDYKYDTSEQIKFSRVSSNEAPF